MSERNLSKISRVIPAIFFLIIALAVPVSAITLTPDGSLASSATIANGDSVFINGIATGHPQQGLQIWIIGPNYLKVTTESVNEDNSYSYELAPADTQQLAPGQYFVVVQHPMMNGRFDITYDPATGRVINQQLGTGTTIFQISGSGSLQSPAAATALIQAISSQNVDDTFAPVAFTIRVPDALIDPIADHIVGDKFTIGGSTNLEVGDDLMVEVYSSSFGPTTKAQSGEFSGASGVVKVVPGSGLNSWSFDVDTSAWKPDEYSVTVTGVTTTVTGTATFSLLQATPVTTSSITPLPTPATTAITQALTTVPATLPSPTRSPVSLIVVIGALAFLIIIRKRGK